MTTAWQNAASTFLERSLDDSASRRIFIPGSFLALDEMLLTEKKVIKGMQIHSSATKRLLESYAVFASTERLLMELGKKGADRLIMHEEIRKESLKAWALVQEGKPNPLRDELEANSMILEYLTKEEIAAALDASSYTGDAVERTEAVLKRAEKVLH